MEHTPDNGLAGKVAVITGGSGTLGRAMAKGLLSAGVKVALIARNLEKLEAAKSELGGYLITCPADVLDRSSLEAAKDRVLEEWGQVDILINAAGGNRKGATVMPDADFFDLSLADLDAVSRLNFQGSVIPTLVFGKEMAKGGSGSIVNISSMAAQVPLTRVVGYSAAKASIDNFTRWLAVEMAVKINPNIRVNAIAPGFFIADQNRELLMKDDGGLTARGETIISQTPMRRFGKPEELVGVLKWLCGDEATFVTGAVIPVDGGFSAFGGV